MVRRLADMPAAERRRVDFEAIEHTLLGRDRPERALGHRRATDIAEAYEQQAMRHHVRSTPLQRVLQARLDLVIWELVSDCGTGRSGAAAAVARSRPGQHCSGRARRRRKRGRSLTAWR